MKYNYCMVDKNNALEYDSNPLNRVSSFFRNGDLEIKPRTCVRKTRHGMVLSQVGCNDMHSSNNGCILGRIAI
jgi:hypothetical protein